MQTSLASATGVSPWVSTFRSFLSMGGLSPGPMEQILLQRLSTNMGPQPNNPFPSHTWPGFHLNRSRYLCQRCLGLGQPEGHVHGAVEGDGSGEFSLSLLQPFDLEIQDAEATVAVGLERAHAEFFAQGEGLAVVISGLIARWRLTLRRNVAEEP